VKRVGVAHAIRWLVEEKKKTSLLWKRRRMSDIIVHRDGDKEVH
jgi:hypothetical protein